MPLTVITGPPCAGKTTLIERRRYRGDLVIDADALAHALGNPTPHMEWGDPHPAHAAALTARRAVLAKVLKGAYSGIHVWLIDSDPSPANRQIYDRMGARLIHLDPGAEECHRRATQDNRPPEAHERIDQWFGLHPPPI